MVTIPPIYFYLWWCGGWFIVGSWSLFDISWIGDFFVHLLKDGTVPCTRLGCSQANLWFPGASLGIPLGELVPWVLRALQGWIGIEYHRIYKEFAYGILLSIPKSWGYPKSFKSVDHFDIETHGDLGIPHDLRKPPIMICVLLCYACVYHRAVGMGFGPTNSKSIRWSICIQTIQKLLFVLKHVHPTSRNVWLSVAGYITIFAASIKNLAEWFHAEDNIPISLVKFLYSCYLHVKSTCSSSNKRVCLKNKHAPHEYPMIYHHLPH